MQGSFKAAFTGSKSDISLLTEYLEKEKQNMNLTSEILKCCYKREDVLKNGLSMTIYNKYFDKMRKSAHILVSEGKQDELLPYLCSESVSIRRDIAGLLYNSYPELCKSIFREI